MSAESGDSRPTPRLLISSGPTHEPLDDVRYLANRSSGKMGHALAQAGLELGLEVELVSGPSALAAPAGVRFWRVETALEMQAALAKRFEACDLLVMAAAVADYRPRRRIAGKIKKEERGEEAVLDLVRNPDILAGLAARRRAGQFLIGFALEAEDGLRRARAKLAAKGVDLLVLDSPQALGAARSDFTLLEPGKEPVKWSSMLKSDFAVRLLSLALGRMGRMV